MHRRLKSVLAALALSSLPIGAALAVEPVGFIDSDGCEVITGYNQVNRCNGSTRTDGLTITHKDKNFVASQPGVTAYVTLLCVMEPMPIFAGQIGVSQTIKCPSSSAAEFATRSICGAKPACARSQ
jgi:hypothetical protein